MGEDNSDTVKERLEGDKTRRPRGRAQLGDNEGRTRVLIIQIIQSTISRDKTESITRPLCVTIFSLLLFLPALKIQFN